MIVRRLSVTPVLPLLVLLASLLAMPVNAAAQRADSARAGARRPPAPTDSVKPPISPKRAFFYSFLLPGYGQSVLDRPIAGALFFGAEITWVALATKSAYDLRYARGHQRDSLIVTYQTNPDGTVKTDSLGNLLGATFARNRYSTERVAARKKHLEDYYALIIANHLLAGAEAFVAAQLWDLPARVSIKALPFGPALAATFRW